MRQRNARMRGETIALNLRKSEKIKQRKAQAEKVRRSERRGEEMKYQRTEIEGGVEEGIKAAQIVNLA